MGIPPYQSPEEYEKMNIHIQHYHDFVKLKGYEKYPFPKNGYIPPYKAEFKAKNGVIYDDSEAFYKATGWYPYYIKDGVCYGMYEPFYKDGYVNPWTSEVDFLKEKGYIPAKPLSHDYLENNRLLEEFYNEHGYVPRWEKDGKTIGHEQALKLEGYIYKGEPEL